MRVLGLVFAGTATPAREAMTRFFREGLGLRPSDGLGSSADLFALPDGASLAVADEREPGAGTSRTIGVAVHDAAAAACELSATGYAVGEVQTNHAYRYVHVTAPDGRLWELVERRDPAARELAGLLADLEPTPRPGAFVLAWLPVAPPADLPVLAAVSEDDGWSVLVSQDDADRAGLSYELPLGWITLQVHSSVAAVGLTAAVSTALTAAGISANVVAGARHDHLLVPLGRVDEALAVLRDLSA